MNNPIGVMQGRLLPKYKRRYQAHPLGYWQDEFPKAAELGLDCIEFILDYKDADQNQLMTLDRAIYGSDLSASVEHMGLKQLVGAVRKIESPMGDGKVGKFKKGDPDCGKIQSSFEMGCI